MGLVLLQGREGTGAFSTVEAGNKEVLSAVWERALIRSQPC